MNNKWYLYSSFRIIQSYVNYPFIINILKKKKLTNILDFGSGFGSTSFVLSQFFKRVNVYGYDNDKNKISYATKVYKNKNLAYSTKLPNNILFDVVVCQFVYAYIPNKNDFFKTIYNLLNTNGVLIIINTNKSLLDYLKFRNREIWKMENSNYDFYFKLHKKGNLLIPNMYNDFTTFSKNKFLLKVVISYISDLLNLSDSKFFIFIKK